MSGEIAGDVPKCVNISKDALKKRELKKLNKIFKVLSPDKRTLINGSMQQLAFMAATLAELQEVIDNEGAVDVYMNGQQRVIREHPATKVYNAMIKNYSSICKQLIDLLPEQKATEATDELIAFVKQAKR